MGLERINEIRKEKGLRIEDLSQRSNVPISTLKKICAGTTTNPALETVKSIARALDCTIDEFDDISKAPASEQELSKEAHYIAMCFERADEEGKALLRHVADYIDGAAQQSSEFEYSEEALAAAAYLDRTLGSPAESPAFADLKNA